MRAGLGELKEIALEYGLPWDDTIEDVVVARASILRWETQPIS